jgi:hypothetical protein
MMGLSSSKLVIALEITHALCFVSLLIEKTVEDVSDSGLVGKFQVYCPNYLSSDFVYQSWQNRTGTCVSYTCSSKDRFQLISGVGDTRVLLIEATVVGLT